MKIFLSWSGEQSKAYANALRDWLPLVVHFVDPWVSDADIDAGERWASEVGKELESSNFGILCINRENVSSQWLLFEAGALSRSMLEGRVIPLLFDIDFKDISGPLAQFQAKKFEERGVWDIICALNKLGDSPVPDGRLKQLFEALWNDLSKTVEVIPTTVKTGTVSRPTNEILEELVSSVRGLDIRLREGADIPQMSTINRSRASRMMQREMMARIDLEPGNPLRLLIMASTVREEIPWLYEFMSEIYRQDVAGNKIKGNEARQQLVKLMRISMHRLFDDKYLFELFHEIEQTFFHELQGLEAKHGGIRRSISENPEVSGMKEE
jgi:hypothetical protein